MGQNTRHFGRVFVGSNIRDMETAMAEVVPDIEAFNFAIEAVQERLWRDPMSTQDRIEALIYLSCAQDAIRLGIRNRLNIPSSPYGQG
jgi:hypothetical protein